VQGRGKYNGVAVEGLAGPGGVGIYGHVLAFTTGMATAGVGVLAEHPFGGSALQVRGVATFNRSGVVTLQPGDSSYDVTTFPLFDSSFVLATLQDDVPGTYVQSVTVVPSPPAVPPGTPPGPGTFTIHLNQAVTALTRVGWFLVS
jgi:hypothetical protein